MPCGSWGSNGDGGSSKNVRVCVMDEWVCVCIRGPVWGARTLNGLLQCLTEWSDTPWRDVWCDTACIWLRKKQHMCPKRGIKICLARIQNNVLLAPHSNRHDRACCNYHLRAFSLVEPLQWKAGAVPKKSWSHPAVGQHLFFPLIIG